MRRYIRHFVLRPPSGCGAPVGIIAAARGARARRAVMPSR